MFRAGLGRPEYGYDKLKWDLFITMNKLLVTLAFLAALGVRGIYAAGVVHETERPLSIATLRDIVTTPRIYKVEAYVVQKDDECPPCPPNAVCETCQLGIYVADDGTPSKAGVNMKDGMYLRTKEASSFQVGGKYLLTIKYNVERNAAGAWLQTGPELVDFARIKPVDEQN